MPAKSRKFRNQRRGTSIVEYSIMLAMVVLASLISILSTSGGISSIWKNNSEDFTQTISNK